MKDMTSLFSKFGFLLATFLLATLPVLAQQPVHDDARPSVMGQDTYSLTLKAYASESFKVYLDGDIVNRRALREVVVEMRGNQPHDIFVVLERPEEKITMVTYTPFARREECRVYYNSREGRIELALPHQDCNFSGREPERPEPERPGLRHSCSDGEVDLMVERLRAEDFDSGRDRLAMGYVMQHHLSSRQILRLCMEFSFESNKVDFLKRAYPYCADPEHYEVVTEALAFNSNKKDIRDMMKKFRNNN